MAEETRYTPEEYLCKTWFCKAWNSKWNPLGNAQEPLPYPLKRKEEADASWLPNPIWWALRNPAQNLMSHIIGIQPVGDPGEIISPEQDGWERVTTEGHWSYWKKGGITLPYYRNDEVNIGGRLFTVYIGWTSRGNFGIAFRKA